MVELKQLQTEADLNTEAAGPPNNGDVYLVLNSSNMTAAAGAAPGNTTAINGLPETVANGQPVGGYGIQIQVTVQWNTDLVPDQWQFIRWTSVQPDNRCCVLKGTADTKTNNLTIDGTLIMDDSLQY